MSKTMTTFTGRHIDPFALTPDDIDPIDIVASLSKQCRFGGHTREFYSVAQHSVLVHLRVRLDLPTLTREGVVLEFQALLHDASECYFIDFSRPLKNHSSFAFYKALEREVNVVIGKHFDLELVELPSAVVEADLRMCATEAYWQMPTGSVAATECVPYEDHEPIDSWSPEFARRSMLACLDRGLAARKALQ